MVRIIPLLIALLLPSAALAMEGKPLILKINIDRLERHTGDEEATLWDADIWAGGDTDKLWIKTEGERQVHGTTEDAVTQVLWSRAIDPFWDLQLGIAHDHVPGDTRSQLVVGLMGLAPQWVEMDAAFLIGDDRSLSFQAEAETDWLITQKLILQPRIEIKAVNDDVPSRNLGAGITALTAEARLKYAWHPQVMPYIGGGYSWKPGKTGNLAKAAGGRSRTGRWIAGISLWF